MVCRACASVGTNDTSTRAHSPSCPKGKVRKFQFGDTLPNSATVIAVQECWVLAYYKGDFVTWRFEHYSNSEEYSGDVEHGHYFALDIAAAAKDFEQRWKQWARALLLPKES